MPYKVFLSYCHRDNLAIHPLDVATGRRKGWVDLFYEELTGHLSLRGLGAEPVFRDTTLNRGALLTDAIDEALSQVAVFLMLSSNHFYGSTWCPGELDHFLSRFPELRVGNCSRVVEAVFFPSDKEYQRDELSDSLRVPLYHDKDGEPFVYNLLRAEHLSEFQDRVQELALGLKKIWKAHQEQGEELDLSAPAVYLAPSDPSLRFKRQRVHNDLRNDRVRVLEVLVPEHLGPRGLAVHVVGNQLTDTSLAKIQASIEAGLTPWVWTTAQLDELQYENWVISRGGLDHFTRDLVSAVYANWAPIEQPQPGKVFMHHDSVDQEAVYRLGDFLEEKQFSPVFRENEIHGCSGELILYDKAPLDWVESTVSRVYRERSRGTVYVCGDLKSSPDKRYFDHQLAHVIKERSKFPPPELLAWLEQRRVG